MPVPSHWQLLKNKQTKTWKGSKEVNNNINSTKRREMHLIGNFQFNHRDCRHFLPPPPPPPPSTSFSFTANGCVLQGNFRLPSSLLTSSNLKWTKPTLLCSPCLQTKLVSVAWQSKYQTTFSFTSTEVVKSCRECHFHPYKEKEMDNLQKTELALSPPIWTRPSNKWWDTPALSPVSAWGGEPSFNSGKCRRGKIILPLPF